MVTLEKDGVRLICSTYNWTLLWASVEISRKWSRSDL